MMTYRADGAVTFVCQLDYIVFKRLRFFSLTYRTSPLQVLQRPTNKISVSFTQGDEVIGCLPSSQSTKLAKKCTEGMRWVYKPRAGRVPRSTHARMTQEGEARFINRGAGL